MMKVKRRPVRQFIRKHIVAIVLIGVVSLSVSGFLTWQVLAVNDYVKKTDRAVQYMNQESKRIKEEAVARITAQKEAEEKAKQEAKAKEAAEKARTGPYASIDPKACNTSKTHNNPAEIDVVVNKKHCIQPLRYSPSDLVSVRGATLSAKAVDAFNNMYISAASAGQPFYVTSSYRSYNTQIATYNRWVSISGRTGADTYSARPGYSEHQTGFVIDVATKGCTLDCFGKTSQYKWFQQNSAKYGFIQRYHAGYESITGYKAEEWHYRYVGVEVALDMQAKGIKTLEQYWNISGGDY